MITQVIFITALIIALWLFFIFLLPLLFLPNQLLIKTKIKRTEKIKKFAKKLIGKNKEKTLKEIYLWTINNFKGEEERYKLMILPKLFKYNVEKLMQKKQFAACHVQNLVLLTLLVNTSQFHEKDIERKETMTFFGTVHQYLIVNTGKSKFKVDPFFKIFKKIER